VVEGSVLLECKSASLGNQFTVMPSPPRPYKSPQKERIRSLDMKALYSFETSETD
jgi:hypothetical protein